MFRAQNIEINRSLGLTDMIEHEKALKMFFFSHLMLPGLNLFPALSKGSKKNHWSPLVCYSFHTLSHFVKCDLVPVQLSEACASFFRNLLISHHFQTFKTIRLRGSTITQSCLRPKLHVEVSLEKTQIH